MQMIDIKTNSPPLSIVSIEVEQLFGRYNYTLSKKDIDGIYNTVMKEVHALKAKGDIQQLKPKLELLKTLANLM